MAFVCGLANARQKRTVMGERALSSGSQSEPCKRQLTLLLVLVMACAAISGWVGICDLPGFIRLLDMPGLRLFKMLQLNRLYWAHGALWAVAFAVALTMIYSAFRGGRLVAIGLILMQLATAIYAQRLLQQEQPLRFAEFFSSALFANIREFIGDSQANYRVASLGMHPSIALYNGFCTVDGYWVNYPLEYKHRFRRVIAKELEKDAVLQAYFDRWGSRCYLFSAELGRNYLYTKGSCRRRVEQLDIDTGALADLGARYILSAVEIGNASQLNLRHKKTFACADSPWQIYLYALPNRGKAQP
jgi:hypothetical protein